MTLNLPPLPEKWTWGSLSDLCEVITDGDHQPPPKAPEGVPLIVIGNLTSGIVDLSNARQVKREYFDRLPAWRRPVEGDVLYTLVGTFGLAVLVTNCASFCIQRHVGLLRPRSEVDSRYLLHVLNGPVTLHQAKQIATGTAQKTVPLKGVRRMKVPLAPHADQHRIVAAIETHFSRLDVAVASLTRAKANVKRARGSVLAAAVEGRLVPTEAAVARAEGRDYEPAAVLLERILAERRAAWAASGKKGRYKEPVAPETATSPELPEGWCWVTVDQLAAEPLSNGRSVPTQVGGFPVLRLTAMEDGRIDFSEAKGGAWSRDDASPWLVERGDFFIMRGNGSLKRVGTAAIAGEKNVEAAFPDTMIRLRPAKDLAEPRYLLAAWSSSQLRSQIEASARTTAGIHKVNQSSISGYVVPVPPLTEQRRIVTEVDRRLSVLDAIDRSIDTNLARCARLRQSILKRAFEGRLVPAAALGEDTEAVADAS